MSDNKAVTKDSIKKNTVKDMRALGVYKKEYNPLIDIYAGLQCQYITLTKEYEAGGCSCETVTMGGGAKTSPVVRALETLRKDILAYSDRLCLNPKALDTVDVKQPKKSALVVALERRAG